VCARKATSLLQQRQNLLCICNVNPHGSFHITAETSQCSVGLSNSTLGFFEQLNTQML